jgi:hypothetical protein
MSNVWLQHPTTSNLLKKSYIKTFVDISGDVYVRNENIEGFNSDISMNGTIICDSLTLTESTGAGVNTDIQTANNLKQNVVSSGTGITLSGDTISASDGGLINVSETNTTSFGSTVNLMGHLYEENYINVALNNTGYGTFFGLNCVNMSGDGTTFITGVSLIDVHPTTNQNAGGAVVIKRVGSSWVKKGSHIWGKIASQIPYQGTVEISWDGNIVALGTLRWFSDGVTTYGGYIETYKYVGSSWVQMGQTINGVDINARGIGTQSFKFANNGLTMIFPSNWANSPNGPDYEVFVYDYNNSTELWVLRSRISAEYNNYWGGFLTSSSIYFGSYTGYMDITEDGNTMAIGSWQAGKVLVIDYYNNDWHMRPSTLPLSGPASNRYGGPVSITDDSNTLLITEAGIQKAHVYDYNGTTWVLRGTISGSTTWFGWYGAKISYDGNYVFLGDQGFTTYIYYWNGSSWGLVWSLNYGYRRFAISRSSLRFVISGDPGNGGLKRLGTWEFASTTVNSTDISKNLIIIGDLNVIGNISVSGSTVHTSDIREKTNIHPITNSLETIMKLSPEIYDKKDSIGSNTTKLIKESGFIVQEIWYNIQELRHLVVLPKGVEPENIQDMSLNRVKQVYVDMYDISTNGFINTSSDQIEHTNDDGSITYEDINIIDISNNTHKTPDYESAGWGSEPTSINYIGLIAYLIKGIQELKNKIKIQTIEIAELGA